MLITSNIYIYNNIIAWFKLYILCKCVFVHSYSIQYIYLFIYVYKGINTCEIPKGYIPMSVVLLLDSAIREHV